MADAQIRRVTFFAKNPTTCPVCETKFHREDILSGGGRLIAGDLTDELRRQYEASRKFGELYPLIYTLTVCPSCLFAAYPHDFAAPREETVRRVREETEQRTADLALLFRDVDLADFRDLEEGVASYYLAMMCYEHYHRESCPTFKRGLSALRAAWLLQDLHGKFPGENYDYLSRLFHRKAGFFYRLALEKAVTGEEALESGLNYGPDLDKNYGYDGFLYITGLLQFKYGPRKDPERRLRNLEDAKRIVSRLFGTGKASRNKPSSILESAKNLHAQIGTEIKTLKGEG